MAPTTGMTRWRKIPDASEHSPLPKTRLMRRRTGSGWRSGALVALAVNLLVVVVLVHVTRIRHEPAVAPAMAMRMNRVEPPPPSPTDEIAEETHSSAEIAPTTPALPMPPLDFAMSGDAAVQLPVMPAADQPLELPIGIPAFTTELPVGAGNLAMPPAMAGDIDERAQLSMTFDLERYYPRAAKIRGIEGESTVRLVLGADGKVISCTLISSTPPGVFEQAAERLCKSLRFRPAKKAGVAVSSTVTQHIAWKLKK